MKKIKMERTACAVDLSNNPTPLFVLESNYDYTKKYTHSRRIVQDASVAMVLYTDRITLIPKSSHGWAIVRELKSMFRMRSERHRSHAQTLLIDRHTDAARYIDKVSAFISRFDADNDFCLYGFLSYEMVNMKEGQYRSDFPIGYFYLPEVFSSGDGVYHRYTVANLDENSSTMRRAVVSNYEPMVNLLEFIAGEEHDYDVSYRLAKKHIASKRIRTFNPSFTIRSPTRKNAFRIFTALKDSNRAPYNFYMFCFGMELVGSSPAMFIRIRSNRVETSPICGTIPRGRSEAEDEKKIVDLLNSEKDSFELSECIASDLEVKQLSCFNIKVKAEKEIERFNNVFHTSASIEGMRMLGKSTGDVIADHMWPSTILGSPGSAAGKLISEHEVRNWYGGAIGFMAPNDDVDFGTMIRCAAIYNGVATTRVGSTITQYSRAAQERDELLVKASLILNAL